MSSYISPFHDDDDGGYSYFSIEKLTRNLKITQKNYDKACELIERNAVVLDRVVFGYERFDETLKCSMNFTLEEHFRGALAFQRDKFIVMRMSVPNQKECDIWNGNCTYVMNPYEVAMVIRVVEYIRTYRPGDCTDRSSLQFLAAYRKEADAVSDGTEFRTPDVRLLPMLEHDGNTLNLRLSVTASDLSRSYIVRDMESLFDSEQERETVQLGKKSEIDFSEHTFSDESRTLRNLLRDWICERDRKIESASRRYVYVEVEDMKTSVALEGSHLDRFFSLYCGQTIPDSRSKGSSYLLKEDCPKLNLTIQKMTGGKKKILEGITVTGRTPELYHGAGNIYCLTEHSLCRIPDDYAAKLEPLLSASSQSAEVCLQIGRKNLSEFYYNVLPQLREIAVIAEKDSEAIEQILPPEVFFRFYLDVDNGIPECRVETRYGEIGVAIFDLLESPVLREDFRNLIRERQVLDAVMHYFPNFERQNERFLADSEADTFYDILERAVPLLSQYGEIVATDRFHSVQVRRPLHLTIGVSVDSDLLSLEIATDDLSMEELLDIIQSYRKKKRYHRLKTGEFVDINQSIAELSALMETMHISPKEFVKGKMQLPAYRALYLDRMLEQNQEIYARRDSHYKQLIKSFKTVNESDFDVPESLYSVMRSYQRYGHKWLRTLSTCGFGGILADDMGLGKTLQMISVLLAERGEGCTSLVVCPASLVYNWAAEFEKFAPEMRVCIIAGNAAERQRLIAEYADYDVLVTSYDLIKRDADLYEDCNFLYEILDEAQYIKNHNTAASKAVKLIKSRHRFALTGTPIENRLSELWSIFDYLMPGFLYGYETFRQEFETPIVRHSDENAVNRLSRMAKPFILRRLKGDVLRDLPEKLEEDYIVQFDEEQRHIYDAKVLELRQLLDGTSDSDFQTSKIKVLAMLTQIRQICCDPSLLFENYKGGSAKLDAVLEILGQAREGGHRVLLFSQFTSMLTLIEQELDARDIPYYKITGDTPKKMRLEMVDSFNSDDTPVFLISLKAGGTGLNLTGADIVVHYDPWWNVAAQDQATDRAHRIGQTRTVTVYKLIAKNTIEERIRQMQERKQKLADSVLTGENVSLSSLSREELMEILG
ncbi:MAG: DEAD/DEAH box helicase [Oscillospiraceae bacterium]|nr:DEAD/DEAH box helicase [Oscillospiraceae bacterium]